MIKFINNNLRKDEFLNVLNPVKIYGVWDEGIVLDNHILIIDDLYSTGKTLNEVCKVLKRDCNVKKVYCLAMTQTKR